MKEKKRKRRDTIGILVTNFSTPENFVISIFNAEKLEENKELQVTIKENNISTRSAKKRL